jgi:hypothetical protein
MQENKKEGRVFQVQEQEQEQNQNQNQKKDQKTNAEKGPNRVGQEQIPKDKGKKRGNQISTQKVKCISPSQRPQAKPHKMTKGKNKSKDPITPPSKPAHSY